MHNLQELWLISTQTWMDSFQLPYLSFLSGSFHCGAISLPISLQHKCSDPSSTWYTFWKSSSTILYAWRFWSRLTIRSSENYKNKLTRKGLGTLIQSIYTRYFLKDIYIWVVSVSREWFLLCHFVLYKFGWKLWSWLTSRRESFSTRTRTYMHSITELSHPKKAAGIFKIIAI